MATFFLLQVLKTSVGVVRNRSRPGHFACDRKGSCRIPGYDEDLEPYMELGGKRAAASAVVG